MAESQAFLVTGATGGVGAFVARRLLARGDRLLLTGRDERRLAELQAELGETDRVNVFAGDVTARADAAAAAARARERFGHLDGLVHLVGSFHAGTPVALAEPEMYRDLYEANLLSAASATSAVLPHMAGGGYLVYVSSLLALEPMAGTAPYAAAKAALLAWVRALAREVKGRGIHANAVVASLVDTPKMRRRMPRADFSQWVPARDLAEVIAFLTSAASDGMYGSVLPVYGTFALEVPGGAPGARPAPGAQRPT